MAGLPPKFVIPVTVVTVVTTPDNKVTLKSAAVPITDLIAEIALLS